MKTFRVSEINYISNVETRKAIQDPLLSGEISIPLILLFDKRPGIILKIMTPKENYMYNFSPSPTA